MQEASYAAFDQKPVDFQLEDDVMDFRTIDMQNTSQRSRKRVHVPAALHAELTEHAMLIKTIRTNHLLNLTHQLYSHASAQHVVDRENIRKGKGKLKSRDTWTTWPLIDCFIPEWLVEDEVKSLAETVARRLKTKYLSRGHDNHQSESQDDGEEKDDDELEPLSPSLLQALVWQATKVLVCILDSILEQRPAVADSMQNRMWAFNWEGVLRVLISGMTLDRTVISAANKRLSSIYGSSKTLDIALSRIGCIESRTSTLAELSDKHENAFLVQPTVRMRRPPKKRRRVMSKAVIETDTE